MAQRPGDEQTGAASVPRAISTSVGGNSTAFGFSIMITVSFAVLSRLVGNPSVLEMFLFGISAAIAVAVLEGIVSRGFRARLERAAEEVRLLGTAMNFASVAAGVGAAAGVGEVIGGVATWPAAAFFAATTYVLTESAEMLVSERLEVARGDHEAEQPEGQ